VRADLRRYPVAKVLCVLFEDPIEGYRRFGSEGGMGSTARKGDAVSLMV
jgi:hypothetical protein